LKVKFSARAWWRSLGGESQAGEGFEGLICGFKKDEYFQRINDIEGCNWPKLP